MPWAFTRSSGPTDRLPPEQVLDQQKCVLLPTPPVLVLVTGGLAGSAGDWLADLLDQLLRHLVDAHQGPPWGVRAVVQFEQVFHPGDKLAALSRRDAPPLLQPRLERVFLSTRRTVSRDTDSTTFSSTSWSASNCKVQVARSWGGAEQARAIRRASAAPSSTGVRLGRSWGLWARADSSPDSTNRWRTRSTVRCPHPRASAIRASSQAGPPQAWSALRSMRARVRVRADRLPEEGRPLRRPRSSPDRVTRYFFCGMAGLLPGDTRRRPGADRFVKSKATDH